MLLTSFGSTLFKLTGLALCYPMLQRFADILTTLFEKTLQWYMILCLRCWESFQKKSSRKPTYSSEPNLIRMIGRT
eukprot:8955256-Pyramimonas_sp.AAC.1